MSTSSVVYAQPECVARPTSFARLRDYVELTKPRIAMLELVTVAVGACVASWNTPDALTLAHVLWGTALVASSASAANHWLERNRDALMQRTSDRPLPSGRLAPRDALWLCGVSGTLGVAWLLAFVNPLTAGLGVATWLLYVVVYTPLKTRSSLNTVVGAVAGALPILMGFAAVSGTLNLAAFTLFLIVFLWQFPHFMAIAWLYRRQYAIAGMKMLSVVDPTGHAAGRQAVAGALMLVPVSLVPAIVNFSGGGYFYWALLLGLAQLATAGAFCVWRSDASARWLLRASLIYLPSLLLVMLMGPFV